MLHIQCYVTFHCSVFKGTCYSRPGITTKTQASFKQHKRTVNTDFIVTSQTNEQHKTTIHSALTSCRSSLNASTSFDKAVDLEVSWSKMLSLAAGGLAGPSDDDDVVGDVPVRGKVKLLSSEWAPSGEDMPPSPP